MATSAAGSSAACDYRIVSRVWYEPQHAEIGNHGLEDWGIDGKRFRVRFIRIAAALALVVASGCGAGKVAAPFGPSPQFHGATRSAISTTPSPAATTIPFWQSSFEYGGATYPFEMVGASPMTDPASTTVPVVVVPIRFMFGDGTVLDAGPQVRGIWVSPLFAQNSYAAGKTQYGDAVMRSEFWQYVAKTNYHVLLAPPQIEPTVDIAVPAADGYTTRSSNGSVKGYVTFDWFIKTIEPQELMQLNVSPSSLAIFATRSTKVLEAGNYCCYSGYHASFPEMTPSGPAIFTTVWASVADNSVEALSHEVAEWFNDPFYTNDVPKWLQPGETACGGSQLEVGDPVTQYVFRVGGFGMQDEAFYSWFSRQSPSIGIDGRYDLMGKLTQPATSC